MLDQAVNVILILEKNAFLFISQISQVGSGSPFVQGLKSYNMSGRFYDNNLLLETLLRPVLSSWPVSNATLNVLPKKKAITIFSRSESQKVFCNFPYS